MPIKHLAFDQGGQKALGPSSVMDVIGRPAPHDLLTSLMRTRPLVALTSPLIYSLIIPFAFTDLWVSLYQAICFSVFRKERVRRARHFTIDCANFPNLDALEKLNCVYCSYVNGVISYAREIAARTEQYWRPIKHADERHDAHERYADSAAYGEVADLAERKTQLRDAHRPAPRSKEPRPYEVTRAVRPLR